MLIYSKFALIREAGFTGKTFIDWTKPYGITLDDIEPDSPDQNGYIEPFNRTYRIEVWIYIYLITLII
jgi:transposase InsO family protein